MLYVYLRLNTHSTLLLNLNLNLGEHFTTVSILLSILIRLKTHITCLFTYNVYAPEETGCNLFTRFGCRKYYEQL